MVCWVGIQFWMMWHFLSLLSILFSCSRIAHYHLETPYTYSLFFFYLWINCFKMSRWDTFRIVTENVGSAACGNEIQTQETSASEKERGLFCLGAATWWNSGLKSQRLYPIPAQAWGSFRAREGRVFFPLNNFTSFQTALGPLSNDLSSFWQAGGKNIRLCYLVQWGRLPGPPWSSTVVVDRVQDPPSESLECSSHQPNLPPSVPPCLHIWGNWLVLGDTLYPGTPTFSAYPPIPWVACPFEVTSQIHAPTISACGNIWLFLSCFTNAKTKTLLILGLAKGHSKNPLFLYYMKYFLFVFFSYSRA